MIYLVDPQAVANRPCSCLRPKALYGIDPIYM